MLKTDINTLKEQKAPKIHDLSDMNLSDDCSEEKNLSSFKPSFRCTECCLLPLLTLKENESKVEINCMNGHYNEMPLEDYLKKGFQKIMNNVKCSDCGDILEPKKRFKFCSECVKIFCKTCLKRHNRNQLTTTHETISLRKMDTFCCWHKRRFTHYCEICHKNICEDCFYMHNNHEILTLRQIKIPKNKVKELKEAINKEKDIINEIIQMFNNAIASIQKKFNEVIQHKREVILFKTIIEDIYEAKDSCFQIIENIKKLKFNNEPLHLEENMNELDLLFELFNYLNCIDYNVEVSNSILDINENMEQISNIIQNDNFENDNKENININNIQNNYSKKNDKNKSDKNKQFIYKKKFKNLSQNNLTKNEEEKNDENKKVYINNSNIEENSLNNFEGKKNSMNETENNSELNDDNLAIIDKDDKNLKYSKKIIKERINTKQSENNLNKNENKEIENKNELYSFSDGVPVLNEINNKIDEINTNNNLNKNSIEELDDNNNTGCTMNDILQYVKNKTKDKLNRSQDPINCEKENDNKSYFSNNIDDNININKEIQINLKTNLDSNFQNINIGRNINEDNYNISNVEIGKIRNKKQNNGLKKTKTKDKIPKATLKDRERRRELIRDKSMDNFRNKSRNNSGDISKEKINKVKKIEENNLQHNFYNSSNVYDNEMHYNSFEYPYPLNQEKQLNQSTFSNNEHNSFFSERQENKYKTQNDNIKNNNRIRKKENNIKLTNKNYHKEKNLDDFYLYNNENINNNQRLKDLKKSSDLNTKVFNMNEGKDENQKTNNIFYEINDDKSNKNISNNNSNEISNENYSNDISNNNTSNEVSNDELSFDNNGQPKIKKRKRKGVKKKKKIRRINILGDTSDEDISNDNNVYEIYNIKYNENDELMKNEQNNLKRQNIIKKQVIFKKKVHIENNNSSYNEKENENEKFNDSQIPKIMNKTPIGDICPNQEESKFQTPSSQGNSNKNQNSTPTPSPPSVNDFMPEQEQNPKRKKTKKKKKNKTIKNHKKSKSDLSQSFDDTIKLKKKSKKKNKLSANDINITNIQRSNSFDIKRHVPEFETTTKIKSLNFENGITCILDTSRQIFSVGNLIGDIKIFEKNTYKEIQTICEHNGTINSLFKMHDGGILSSSADKLMKKIRLTKNYLYYNVEFIFNGYENYVFKGIELFNRKIISCSWDDKLYLWEEEEEENNKYINSLKFNVHQRVEDLLEISKDKFCSLCDCELKIWNSNNMAQLHSIKLQKGIVTPNSLCKVNDKILISIFYHSIHLIDIINFSLINTISMEQGNLSCITKLNDGSILIAEDINTDSYCIFYLKQYILDDEELQYISYKKDKFYKINSNNDKEIRALAQFSNGIIAQGITSEINGKDSGDIFFYD